MERLYVVIPTRNADNVRVSVPAVRKMEPEAKIIIVDDGADWSGGMPEEFKGVQVIPGDKPFTFARNVNIGINEAQPGDVVVLNDDALLETPGGFTAMQLAAEEHPDIGIIGATTNMTGQPLQRPAPMKLGHLDNPQWGLRRLEHIAFVCVLIPRRTIIHIARMTPMHPALLTEGYLDERYNRGYGSEDRDYCSQVEFAGLRVAVHDGCYVDHNCLVSSFRGAPDASGDIWANHRLWRAKWNLGPNPQDPQYVREGR